VNLVRHILGIFVGLVSVGCLAQPASVATSQSARPEVGIFLPGAAWKIEDLTNLESQVEAKFAYVTWYQDWKDPLDRSAIGTISQHGATPLVVWQPMVDGQPIALQAVVDGRYDAFLTDCANLVKESGRQILISLAPEMNGDWTGWSASKQGASVYRQFFQHVVSKFRDCGVKNAVWLWSPNVRYNGDAGSYESLYPGDDYVDLIGLDGYNWGSAKPAIGWQSFDQIFGRSYAELTKLTKKEIVLTEVSSSEEGGDKADWITGAFKSIRANYPRIRAVIWFGQKKETDWRIDSSSGSLEAFRRSIRQ